MTGADKLVGRCVLVVEDEILVAMLAEEMLADLGCSSLGPETTIEKALGTIASDRFDIALLDVNLRGEPSYPVADSLRERGLPFIFATGYHLDDLAQRYPDVPVLQKPYSPADLRDAMLAVLR